MRRASFPPAAGPQGPVPAVLETDIGGGWQMAVSGILTVLGQPNWECTVKVTPDGRLDMTASVLQPLLSDMGKVRLSPCPGSKVFLNASLDLGSDVDASLMLSGCLEVASLGISSRAVRIVSTDSLYSTMLADVVFEGFPSRVQLIAPNNDSFSTTIWKTMMELSAPHLAVYQQQVNEILDIALYLWRTSLAAPEQELTKLFLEKQQAADELDSKSISVALAAERYDSAQATAKLAAEEFAAWLTDTAAANLTNVTQLVHLRNAITKSEEAVAEGSDLIGERFAISRSAKM